jgi:hypothetical protein
LVKLDGKRLTTVEACNAQIQDVKDRKVAAVFYRGGKELSEEIAPQLSAATAWEGVRYNLNAIPAESQWLNALDRNVWVTNGQGLNHAAVRWLVGTDGSVTANPPATHPAYQLKVGDPAIPQQIAALKQQLEEVQKSIGALEWAIRNANREQQSEKQQSEKQPQEKTDKPQQ